MSKKKIFIKTATGQIEIPLYPKKKIEVNKEKNNNLPLKKKGEITDNIFAKPKCKNKLCNLYIEALEKKVGMLFDLVAEYEKDKDSKRSQFINQYKKDWDDFFGGMIE